jgi:hypothetical protein
MWVSQKSCGVLKLPKTW